MWLLAAIAAAAPAPAAPGAVVLVAPGAPVRPAPEATTHAIPTRAWAATVVELRGDLARVTPLAPGEAACHPALRIADAASLTVWVPASAAALAPGCTPGEPPGVLERRDHVVSGVVGAAPGALPVGGAALDLDGPAVDGEALWWGGVRVGQAHPGVSLRALLGPTGCAWWDLHADPLRTTPDRDAVSAHSAVFVCGERAASAR